MKGKPIYSMMEDRLAFCKYYRRKKAYFPFSPIASFTVL